MDTVTSTSPDYFLPTATPTSATQVQSNLESSLYLPMSLTSHQPPPLSLLQCNPANPTHPKHTPPLLAVAEGVDGAPIHTPTHNKTTSRSQTKASATNDLHNATFSTSTSPLQNNSMPSSTPQAELQQWASTKPTSTMTAYATSPQESPSLSSRNSKHLLKPSNTPNTTRTCHRCRVECEGRRVLQVWENNEGQFPQSSSASDANYASQFIHQTHIAHADTMTTMSLATTPSAVTTAARNVHTILLLASDFAIILSPALAQAGYIYPNTKLDIKTHFHLQSDHTA
jgi:hypothetical protein